MKINLSQLLIVIIGVVVLCILIFRRFFWKNGFQKPQITCDAKGLSKLRNVCENIVCTENSGWKCLDNVRSLCKSLDIPECPQGSYPECIDREWQCVSTCDPKQSANIVCPSGSQVVCVNGQWECLSIGCDPNKQTECTDGTESLCMENGEWSCGSICDPSIIPNCDVGYYPVCNNGEWNCVTSECNPENIPDCLAIGTYPICDKGEWKCGSSCDAYNVPECDRRQVLTCMGGEWKCVGENVPISALQPLKRDCDPALKPDCEYPICLNGEWKCFNNTEGGCNLSNKIDCANGEEPMCMNGNWVCARDILIQKSQNIDYKYALFVTLTSEPMKSSIMYCMINDDYSNLSLDYMTPINISGRTQKKLSLEIKNISGFQILRKNVPFQSSSENNLYFTEFLWNPSINKNPLICFDLLCGSCGWDPENPPTNTDNVEINLFMFEVSTRKIIMYTQVFIGTIDDLINIINYEMAYIVDTNTILPMEGYQWNIVNPITSLKSLKVGFCLRCSTTNNSRNINDGSFYMSDFYVPNLGIKEYFMYFMRQKY